MWQPFGNAVAARITCVAPPWTGRGLTVTVGAGPGGAGTGVGVGVGVLTAPVSS